MKCSECSRRNHDDNQFCIYCGTAFASPSRAIGQSVKKPKVLLPPQDINELISERSSSRRSHGGVHPAIVIGLVIILGLSGVYYYYFYQGIYQITAIDYEGTELINE